MGAAGDVESQVTLALFFIRSVTGETVLGNQRPDVTIEIDWLAQRALGERQQEQGNHGPANPHFAVERKQASHQMLSPDELFERDCGISPPGWGSLPQPLQE